MNHPARLFLALGAFSGALAVAAGAFGAHALADIVTPDRLATFRTGAQYHLVHALALVAVALTGVQHRHPFIRTAGWLFVAGTVLFAGSLYALVLTDTPVLGAVTPFGGVALIAGWICLGIGAWRSETGRG